MCNGDMAARQFVRVVDFALVIFTVYQKLDAFLLETKFNEFKLKSA